MRVGTSVERKTGSLLAKMDGSSKNAYKNLKLNIFFAESFYYMGTSNLSKAANGNFETCVKTWYTLLLPWTDRQEQQKPCFSTGKFKSLTIQREQRAQYKMSNLVTDSVKKM